MGLIDKVLEQNRGSYGKLEDLVGIGRDLVAAGLGGSNAEGEEQGVGEKNVSDLEKEQKQVERRVTFMAVEAALREDDFETAYSYVVNRLTPSGTEFTAPNTKDTSTKHTRQQPRHANKDEEDDDPSWRAAFLAGRYRGSSTPPTLRRLEQRTELLSLALLLAPPSALTDVLANWRRCKEETQKLLLERQQAEERFDDRADKHSIVSGSALPGDWGVGGEEQPDLVLGQGRREMGRLGGSSSIGGGSGGGGGEAPVSMFDLTRSAARALSKGAFPLRAAVGGRPGSGSGSGSEGDGMAGSGEGLGPRVRKRDLVANAVSGGANVVGGGLASGIGWVLGAPAAGREGAE